MSVLHNFLTSFIVPALITGVLAAPMKSFDGKSEVPSLEGSAFDNEFKVVSNGTTTKRDPAKRRQPGAGVPAPQANGGHQANQNAQTSAKPALPTWFSLTTNDDKFSSISIGKWNLSAGNPCGAGTNLVPVAVNEFTPTVAGRTGAVRLMGTTCEVAAVAAAVMAAPRPVVVTTEMFASIDLRQRRTECTCHDVGEQIPAFVVGVPAVFCQDAEPEVVTTTLQGQVVELRATPVAWVMEWGDGSVQLRSKVPGVKWDVNPREKHPSTVAGSLWHVWEHRGYYDLKQTIDYKGEFRVNGGAWQTIAGTVTKPGPSTKVKIRSFIALEVDEDY